MRKTIYMILCLFLLCSVFICFRPLKLSEFFDENKDICISTMEFETVDGEPYINTNTYNDITDEQKKDIVCLAQKYSYRRTLRTAFSDGSMSDLGDIVIHIYVYENDRLITNISVSMTEDISIDEKNYKLPNSSKFIQELLGIINL